MDDQPTPFYYNIKQLGEEFGFDLNQIQYTIEEHTPRMWICIKKKKRPLDNKAISVRETKINTSDDIFFEIRNLSNEELIKEGFKLTALGEPNSYLAERNNSKFTISNADGFRGISIPNLNHYAIDTPHDGFVELSPEKIMDPKGISKLFSQESLYIRVVSENEDSTRFLEPACSITLQDIYLRQDEVARIKATLSKPKQLAQEQIANHKHEPTKNSADEIRMLPHIRESNVLKRADQIAALYNKICVEHPIKIDKDKIIEPIKSINLAWILAFCRMNYNSFGDVDFKDLALNAMAEDIRNNLIKIVDDPSKLANLKAKYLDEVDLVSESTVTPTRIWIIPPDLVISILSNDSIFRACLFNEEKKKNKILKYREDAISDAIINSILPERLPDKTSHPSAKEINQLKRDCFEKLKISLETNGATSVSYTKNRKNDFSFIKGTGKNGVPFRTTFEAFRKRFDSFLESYLK